MRKSTKTLIFMVNLKLILVKKTSIYIILVIPYLNIFFGKDYLKLGKMTQKIWKELCEVANTIFDVGANTGVYSLVAKTINKDAQSFCF